MKIGEITPLLHFMRRQIMSYPSANALGKQEQPSPRIEHCVLAIGETTFQVSYGILNFVF